MPPIRPAQTPPCSAAETKSDKSTEHDIREPSVSPAAVTSTIGDPNPKSDSKFLKSDGTRIQTSAIPNFLALELSEQGHHAPKSRAGQRDPELLKPNNPCSQHATLRPALEMENLSTLVPTRPLAAKPQRAAVRHRKLKRRLRRHRRKQLRWDLTSGHHLSRSRQSTPFQLLVVQRGTHCNVIWSNLLQCQRIFCLNGFSMRVRGFQGAEQRCSNLWPGGSLFREVEQPHRFGTIMEGVYAFQEGIFLGNLLAIGLDKHNTQSMGTVLELVLFMAVVDGYCKAPKFVEEKGIFRHMKTYAESAYAFSNTIFVQRLCKRQQQGEVIGFCLEMLGAAYADAMPLAVQFLTNLPSEIEVTIKSHAGRECSAYDSSKTCELIAFSSFVTTEDLVQATQRGNVPDISMLEPGVRTFQTEVLKRASKCAELVSNSEDRLVGVILELDAMDLADQHIGEYPPKNGDVTTSRTEIVHTVESSNTCNAPAVPSSVIDNLAMHGAETRRVFLETRTRKRKCRMAEVTSTPVSVALEFNVEGGSSGVFMGSMADSVEIVHDQHIGKHPLGNESITTGDAIRPFSGRCAINKKLCQSGNQHKLV